MKISKFFLSILFAGIFLANSQQASAQCTGKDAALATLGMQGGLVLYNTYIVIGSINDGYSKDTWDKQYVTDLLDEQISMMNKICDQYDSLMDSNFLNDPSDRESLVTMRKGERLLKREASALKDYINDSTDENRKEYNDARDESWKLIADFLGIKDEGK